MILECGSSIVSIFENIKSILIIYDVKETHKSIRDATFDHKIYEHINIASFQINMSGIIILYCFWTYAVVEDGRI